MTIRGIIAAAVCALLLAGGVSALSGAGTEQGDSKAALEKQLQELLEDRVKSAERAVEAFQAAFEAQTCTLDVFIEAANKLVEARLAVATTPAQEIAALEKHLERMQAIEQKILVLYKIGARGGEAKEYAMAKRERQSAEIALIEARLKSSR
jgi:hypothetical protein